MEGLVRQVEVVRALEAPSVAAGVNCLIHGDNLRALAALSMSGETIDLCYTDPPYNTGRQFSTHADEDAYRDSWESDEAFYAFLEPRFALLHSLLAAHGAMYVHIDVRIAAYLRVLLLDPIFGKKSFRGEITRIKSNPKNFARKAYGNTSDRILHYTVAPLGRAPDVAYWGDYRAPLTAEQEKKQFPRTDDSGRRFATTPLYATGTSKGATGGPWRGELPPRGKHWRRAPEILEAWDAAGKIHWSKDGNGREIIYADEHKGNKIQDVWHFKDRGGSGDQYPTEKNLAMLEQIVQQSSPEGGLVVDPFAGSGGTCVAAAKHGRRFIGMDSGAVSLAVSLRRLSLETDAAFELWAADDTQLIWPGAGELRRELASLADEQLLVDAIDPPHNASDQDDAGVEPRDPSLDRPLMVFAVQTQKDGALRAVPLQPGTDERTWTATPGLMEACDRVLVADRTGRLTLHFMPPSAR